MSALIEADGLELVRGERLLFSGLGFALNAGDCLLVEGPNGSGKTSLIRVLAGLLAPTAGTVRWRGNALGGAAQAYRAELVYCGHRVGGKLDLSVRENLQCEQALRPRGRLPLDEILGMLGLTGLIDLPLRVLSAGQQRRVALARVLLSAATLWLLDEPLTNLDSAGRDLVNAELRAHGERGGISVVAAHAGIADDIPAQRLVLA